MVIIPLPSLTLLAALFFHIVHTYAWTDSFNAKMSCYSNVTGWINMIFGPTFSDEPLPYTVQYFINGYLESVAFGMLHGTTNASSVTSATASQTNTNTSLAPATVQPSSAAVVNTSMASSAQTRPGAPSTRTVVTAASTRMIISQTFVTITTSVQTSSYSTTSSAPFSTAVSPAVSAASSSSNSNSPRILSSVLSTAAASTTLALVPINTSSTSTDEITPAESASTDSLVVVPITTPSALKVDPITPLAGSASTGIESLVVLPITTTRTDGLSVVPITVPSA